jgi:hypothetical protein
MVKAVKRGIRENLVEAELVARVRAMGGRADKVQVIGRRGFFDRLVILPGGRIFFVEVKRPRGGRLSPHQIWYLREFDALDVAIAVVRNSEDITRLLASEK